MTAAIANHNTANAYLARMHRGAMADLAPDEKEEQHAEHEVQPGEPDQREEHGAGFYRGTRALSGSHQAVDDPRLSPQLRGHPAGRGGDVGKRKRQHQDPEHG